MTQTTDWGSCRSTRRLRTVSRDVGIAFQIVVSCTTFSAVIHGNVRIMIRSLLYNVTFFALQIDEPNVR